MPVLLKNNFAFGFSLVSSEKYLDYFTDRQIA
jgi:hypothetical protein